MLPEGAKPIIAAADEAPAARSGNGASEGRRWGRWIAFLFVFSAVVGFGSLLAYTYLETRDGPVDPSNLPVVRADARPMKIRPETPGGIDVPFQDKEVFERLGQQAAGPARPGQAPAQSAQRPPERLLPGPEQPLPRPVATPPPPPTIAVPAAPEVAPPPNAVPVTPPPRASVPPGGAAAPAPVPQAPAQAAQAPRAAPAPPAPAAQASGIRIQLASVRSEADAQREWDRMRRQQSDVLGALTPMFPSADLGERGVFWRVQAGGFTDLSAAQEACAALRGRGLGCNVVR
jgi:SPOR domain